MSAPTLLGSGTNTAGSTGTNIPLTVSATAAGLVLVAIMVNASDFGGVGDSVGNAYTLVKSDTAAFPNTYIYKTTQNVGHLLAGSNVTLTTSGTHAQGVVLAAVLDCPGYSATPDQTASQQITASTARGAGTTPVTTSPNELVVGVFGAHVLETAFTPGAGYTSIFSAPPYLTDSGALNALEIVYQEVAAKGSYSPTGVGGVSGNSTGVTATFPATVQPANSATAGFVRAADGSLVTGTGAGSMVNGFLRDASGALIFGSTAPESVQNGFLRDANYALVKSAGPGTMQDGFLRDSSYALVTVTAAGAAQPTKWERGFLVDATGALVTS